MSGYQAKPAYTSQQYYKPLPILSMAEISGEQRIDMALAQPLGVSQQFEAQGRPSAYTATLTTQAALHKGHLRYYFSGAFEWGFAGGASQFLQVAGDAGDGSGVVQGDKG